jgi:hypothetical protein
MPIGSGAGSGFLPRRPVTLRSTCDKEPIDLLIWRLYKWRRPPWMIEIVIGAERDGKQKDKVLWVTITSAVG